MKPYRLIALDIDGTLLNSKKEIPPENAEAVRQAAEQGKWVVFCTGRAVCELQDLYFGLPQVRYAVFASGGGIYDAREKRAFSLRGIPRSQAEAILALAATKDLMPQIVTPDKDVIQRSHLAHLAHYHMEPYRSLYEKTMTLTPDIFAFASACPDPFLKINLYHADPPERERTRAQLAHLDMEKAYSEVSSLEFSAKDVNKGTGLIRLCQALGVEKEECVAVGDAENDIPMLRAAGLGVAMGNAAAPVRAAADKVTGDLDHGGCAGAIRLLLD